MNESIPGDDSALLERVRGRLFDLSQDVRYVAVYRKGKLETAARPGLTGASSSESDKYEEIIVNPTLLTLLRQRGGIDCGGLHYVVVRYGNFFQFIQPIPGGHISIALEPTSNYERLLPRIRQLVSGELS